MSVAGAFDTTLDRYVNPFNAEKGHSFTCVECKQKVILRKGTVRIAHFAHYSPTNTCSYFEHPSESQQHKDAKFKLAGWLRDKYIDEIWWSCKETSGSYSCSVYDYGTSIDYKEGDEVIVEYRDPYKKYIADIAIINNNCVRYIFEIFHTHRTISGTRPEPWYEVSTEEILETVTELANKEYSPPFSITCCRNDVKRLCQNHRATTESWFSNIPSLAHKVGAEAGWKQDRPCISCGRDQYNPVFSRGFKQLCKHCLSNDSLENLREKYAVAKPLFRT